VQTRPLVCAVRYPAATKREYDCAGVYTYNSLANIERPLADITSRVHPNTALAELGQRTASAHDLVRRELWYQIDEAQ
jgi:hypothetical protein